MAEHPADYPFKVNKVTIMGDCWDGAEEWTTGFYLGSPSGDAADPGSATAAAIAPLWTTFFTATGTKISNVYRTLQIKVSQLDTDGDVDLDKIDIYDYPTAIAGASSSSPMPPQIALAATLTSDIQRGLASKGRMFLPGVNAGISTTDPKITATDQGNIATNLKTFFDAVNASGSIANDVVLASKGHKLTVVQDPDNYSYVNGVIAEVTGLRVGDAYDTQRRRRNAIGEVYALRVLA
jgi:hypothetical protein